MAGCGRPACHPRREPPCRRHIAGCWPASTPWSSWLPTATGSPLLPDGRLAAAEARVAVRATRLAPPGGAGIRASIVTQREAVELLRAVAEGVGLLRVRGDRLEATSLRNAWSKIDETLRAGLTFAAWCHRVPWPEFLRAGPGVEALVARRHWCCVRCSACPPGPSWPARPGIGVWSRAPADLRQLPDAGSRSRRRKVNCQLSHRRVLFGSDGESV
jgi:hypothetical protein